MDDDIVCLGTSKPAPNRSEERSLSAITLHVEKYGSTPPHTLTFYRSATSVVLVGRRSASDNPGDDYIVVCDKNASFRCAVVSRRHGKIAFSDSGHAYLIDLGSHHGTYIRSLADRASRALVRETPTLLMDGDIITFGKAVGRGDDSVQPVIARVELVYVPASHTSDDSVGSSSSSRPHISPASSGRPSTGRYGIHVGSSSFSSSSSSDDDGDSLGHDSFSDIEEIPPPVIHQIQSQDKSVPQQGQSSISVRRSQGESLSSAWVIHPPPPLPQMINRVVNTLLPQGTTSPQVQSSAPAWLTRLQCQMEENLQPLSTSTDGMSNNPQDTAVNVRKDDCDASRTLEDEHERRLRDALARRRAQRQVQGNNQSAVPTTAETDVPSTSEVPADTPLVTNNGMPTVTSDGPTPATITVLNRLPSMATLIERPLLQLSQYILGGLSSEKTKQVINDSIDSGDMNNAMSKSADVEPTNVSAIGAPAAEQAPVGSERPDSFIAPGSGNALPLLNMPPPPQSGMLPSLAAALSPGHGNGHLNAHANIIATTQTTHTWMRPWLSSPQAGPSPPTAMMETISRPLLPPLPANPWNTENSQWWEPYAMAPQAPEVNSLDNGQIVDHNQSRAVEINNHVPIAAPVPTPYYDACFPRFSQPNMDTEHKRGPAQSPPPPPLVRVPVSPSPSPGLSYASSREPSPSGSAIHGEQVSSHEGREESEPMDLSSRSTNSSPHPYTFSSSKDIDFERDFGQWFAPDLECYRPSPCAVGGPNVDDEDCDDDDDDGDEGERDMDIEADSVKDDSSTNSGSLALRPRFGQLLREAIVLQEEKRRRAQEQEREAEHEREKGWQMAVEKREIIRHDNQTEAELRYLREDVKVLQADLDSLRAQSNTRYTVHSDQLSSFDGRIREVDAECGVLCVRVESLGERLEVAEIDVASLNAAVDNILSNERDNDGSESRVSQDGDDGNVESTPSEAEMRALFCDINAIRASTRLQIEEELCALRALRSEAEAAYTALIQRMHAKAEETQDQTKPPVLPSLKRKRDDIDEDEAALTEDDNVREGADLNTSEHGSEFEHDPNAYDVVMNAPPRPLATSDSVVVSFNTISRPASFPSTEHDVLIHREDQPPPRKRARKIARFVARTVTAVGVGAVVTWTALAYS